MLEITDYQYEILNVRIYVRQKNVSEISEKLEATLTKREQKQIEDLVGDGNAQVTVGMDMKEASYGTGVGCFVSVKLTCGQNETQIEQAHGLAQKLAIKWVDQGYEKAAERLNEILSSDPEETPPSNSKPKFNR